MQQLEDLQRNDSVAVVLPHPGQQPGIQHFNRKFFTPLAHQSLHRRLSRIHRAARDLPQATLVGACMAQLDQDTSPAVPQDSRHHMDFGRHLYVSENRIQAMRPWHCLYFLPDPQGQGSLRPTFRPSRTNG